MKELFNRLVGLYLTTIAFLAAVVGALVVVAQFATYVPLLLIVVGFAAAAWRWARGDWG